MKYMKVLLINPPFQRFFGGGKSPKLPLGLCYIASYLTYNGYETFVYDANSILLEVRVY
jgi:hypothetical protein